MTRFNAILRCAVHIPRLRLSRATIAAAMAWANPPARSAVRGARAVCNWDEDALTLAVEAARGCGAPAGAAQETPPKAVIFCSTTAPFADRDDAVMLSAALDLPEAVETANLTASMRAGTRGLISASRMADDPVLVVASDARRTRAGSPQELTYGDAAAAVLLGPATTTALASVVGACSVGSDFVDSYRMSGAQFDYGLEERWVRDESLMKLIPRTVADLLRTAGLEAAGVRHIAIPAGAATAARVADACGMPTARRDSRVLLECGDAGVAQPLLLLADALEAARPGEFIVLLGIGQGVDAVLLRAENGVGAQRPLARALAGGREEPSYVRYLSHRHLLDVDFGMRAERDQRTAHTVAYRKRAALSAFKGGRCGHCGTVQFPQARVCVNPECRATDTQSPYRLADSRGRVKTFTEDWQAYAARPPYSYGNVEFAEGGNLLMEFTDVEPGELQVNDPLRFVYRIKDEDRARGFRRYFWKATKLDRA